MAGTWRTVSGPLLALMMVDKGCTHREESEEMAYVGFQLYSGAPATPALVVHLPHPY